MTALFAQVVFLSDGLLRLTPQCPPQIARFFTMTSSLPIEIQMIICSRQFGLPHDIVLSKNSEPAFKELAKYFILREMQ